MATSFNLISPVIIELYLQKSLQQLLYLHVIIILKIFSSMHRRRINVNAGLTTGTWPTILLIMPDILFHCKTMETTFSIIVLKNIPRCMGQFRSWYGHLHIDHPTIPIPKSINFFLFHFQFHVLWYSWIHRALGICSVQHSVIVPGIIWYAAM